jgi:hypothetical protein
MSGLRLVVCQSRFIGEVGVQELRVVVVTYYPGIITK